MGLATGVSLADPVAIIDALQTELVNQNWTIDNNIAGGIGTRELYFSKALGDTFNGETMSFGIWAASTDRLETSFSWDTYATWTAAGVDLISNNFNSGSMVNPDTVFRNSTTSFWEIRVEDLNTGGNYIRHWILTPTDTSTGGTPADHQYVYMVIEISTGLYRSFFFGESIKYDNDVWEGGQFAEGNTFDAISTRPVHPFDGAFQHNIFSQNRGKGGFVCKRDNFLAGNGSDIYDAAFLPDVNQHFVAIGQNYGSPANVVPWRGPGMGPDQVGEDHFERSNAAFSGLAQRWPAELIVEREHDFPFPTQNANLVPCSRIPDFFFTNLGNFTPGAVVVDDTENFLAVPYSSKGGSLNTGNRGFLIRNPLL